MDSNSYSTGLAGNPAASQIAASTAVIDLIARHKHVATGCESLMQMFNDAEQDSGFASDSLNLAQYVDANGPREALPRTPYFVRSEENLIAVINYYRDRYCAGIMNEPHKERIRRQFQTVKVRAIQELRRVQKAYRDSGIDELDRGIVTATEKLDEITDELFSVQFHNLADIKAVAQHLFDMSKKAPSFEFTTPQSLLSFFWSALAVNTADAGETQ
ncbi:hypothetical protein BRY73_23955 [Ochrobactrum sp. P6BS-III]|uniref:hypothetical protein n=1 Tax=unclassified Ochrobactrum TaxID=239106 RepID=UPI0009947C43|nr:hypothetical protein [Ochrobactrum sp. P6BSIII]OOL14278.1 hypothetical protein BRY73_23955 [Ochrobactrum sp. P6BS-III]